MATFYSLGKSLADSGYFDTYLGKTLLPSFGHTVDKFEKENSKCCDLLINTASTAVMYDYNFWPTVVAYSIKTVKDLSKAEIVKYRLRTFLIWTFLGLLQKMK